MEEEEAGLEMADRGVVGDSARGDSRDGVAGTGKKWKREGEEDRELTRARLILSIFRPIY